MEFVINGVLKTPAELTKDEINEAWDVLKQAHGTLVQREAAQFYKGQRVSFKSRKRGGIYEGNILRINQKTIAVDVDTENGDKLPFPQHWKVSPNMLTVVK